MSHNFSLSESSRLTPVYKILWETDSQGLKIQNWFFLMFLSEFFIFRLPIKNISREEIYRQDKRRSTGLNIRDWSRILGNLRYRKKYIIREILTLKKIAVIILKFEHYGFNIRATSWENLFMPYANNKGADQPAHPHSLIRTFVVCFLDSIKSLVSISEIASL